MADETNVNFDALKNLYGKETPNLPILYSALERKIKAAIVADDAENPKLAAVRTPDGITFFSPQAGEGFIRGSLRKLQLVGPVMAIVREPNERFPKPDVIIPRYEFRQRDDARRADIPDLPGDVSIQPMTESLLAGCEWRSLIEMSYGTLGEFFRSGYGFLLMGSTEIVTEAYAAFVGAGTVEIGVLTAENYRGRGFATIAASHLTEQIEREGMRPYWSCDCSNAGSIAVANKLGFVDRRDYTIYGYRPLKVPDLAVSD